MADLQYPWYSLVTGDDLEQGDILEEGPVFRPPDDLGSGEPLSAFFEAEALNVVVISQSCDLAKGREKLSEVLLCPLWDLIQFPPGHHLATAKGREEARRGNLPSIHVLAASTSPGFERGLRVVDFRQVYSLPLTFARKRAGAADRHPAVQMSPPEPEVPAKR